MRILLVPSQYIPEIGGVETCVQNLTSELLGKGNEIAIVTAKFSPWSKSFELIDGIAIYRLPCFVKLTRAASLLSLKWWECLRDLILFPYATFRLYKIIKEGRFDIVNLHFASFISIAILLIYPFSRFKFVFTLHGCSSQVIPFAKSQTRKMQRWVFKRLLQVADYVIAPSKSLLADALKYNRGIIKKSAVIINGVNLDEFKSKKPYRHFGIASFAWEQSLSSRNSPKLSWPGRPYILAIGDFCHNSSFVSLLYAFKDIVADGYDLDLVIYAHPGPYMKDYRELIHLLKLNGNVRIVDETAGTIIDSLLLHCRFVAFPEKEGICQNVYLLKALTFGRAILCSKTEQSIRTFHNTNSAFFIKMDDRKAVYKLMRNLLNNGQWTNKISARDNRITGNTKNMRFKPYIFSLANYHPCGIKGQDLLIRAFKKIVDSGYEDIDLILGGDGLERNNCEFLAWSLGLEDKVLFWGKVIARTEVEKLLNGCELFVCPSRIEPFGIVNLEAMAAGKAIVATNVDGIREIISDGENGILVEPNEDAISQGIMRLLEDRGLREQLAQNARKTAEQEGFRWDRIANEYLKVYEKTVKTTSPKQQVSGRVF